MRAGMRASVSFVFAIAFMATSWQALAAAPPDREAMIDEQKTALAPLAILDGLWRGPAKVYEGGKVIEVTQTERVGPFLGGTMRVIEGRGFLPDGTLRFNAFAVISYLPMAKKYNFRSYAEGFERDFPIDIHPDGFAWSINAGPAGTIRYTAKVKDNVWTERGERLVEGQPPILIFEMALQRIGNTSWPEAGAVPPR